MVNSEKSRWLRTLLVALLAVAGVTSFGSAAAADPGDIGIEGPTYLGASGSHPSGEKPESKLWYHDGTWWGSLWSDTAGSFNVHRLDAITEQWTDCSLAGIQARLDLQNYAFARGKIVVCNTYATSMEEQALPANRFVGQILGQGGRYDNLLGVFCC